MEIPRAARKPVFHARGLKKNYESAGGQVTALRGVDLDLYHCSCVCDGRNGRAEATPIKVRAISGGLAALASGLQEGEPVIMYPGDLIHKKMRVKQFAGVKKSPP